MPTVSYKSSYNRIVSSTHAVRAASSMLRMQPGYDHSYFFIASFIGEHLAHHAGALQDG